MSAEEQRERRFHLVGTFARLRSGSSTAQAERELDTIYRQLRPTIRRRLLDWSARVLPLPRHAAR